MHTIFVQIASYRDPELVPTVLDCIANAKWPKSLHICVGWQHAEDEDISLINNLPNVKIIDIPYQKSKGACWVRNKIQQYYDNETYTLQLDSHHRFCENWDEQVIEMYKSVKTSKTPKPIITSYLPSYQPNNDPAGRLNEVWQLNYDRFLPEGVIFKRPSMLHGWEKMTKPAPSRGLSGHFVFTEGKWCLEVPYDPDLYFHGEEISLAARSFTHGYDLFHPHKPIVWHHYTREGTKKHWDDHSQAWGTLNSVSYKRVKILFGTDNEDPDQINWGSYGFGVKRTLREFELYAGVDFKSRRFHGDVLKEKLPTGIPFTEEELNTGLCNWTKYCIDVYKPDLPLDDYTFWCVVFKDAEGRDLFRKDADANEIKHLINQDPNDKFVHVWREFRTNIQPVSWTIWPHSKSKGWETKILENKIPYA